MSEIHWIDTRTGLCDGPHPGKYQGKWRYPVGRTAIRKFTKANGSINYELLCTVEGCRFKTSSIPNVMAEPLLAKLPILAGRHNNSGRVCSYQGCESTHIEFHHFAPRNTFGLEAENYPIHPLCREHHHHWHQQMDGYRWQQRQPDTSEETALQLLQTELGATRIA